MTKAATGEESLDPPQTPSALDALAHYLSLAGERDARRSAGALLREFGSIGRMLSGSVSRLASIVDRRTAALILASGSLVQTSLREQLERGPVLTCRRDVIQYLQLQIGWLRHECLIALYLDQGSRLIHSGRIAEGAVGSAVPSIPRIVHIALDVGAGRLMLVHNHPSGDPTPSRSDLLWTARLSRVATELEITLVDHIIVTGSNYRSMFEISPAE